MKFNLLFNSKYKIATHIFVFSLCAWSIFNVFSFAQKFDASFIWSELFPVLIFIGTLYILSWWLIPILFKNYKRGILFLVLYLGIYVTFLSFIKTIEYGLSSINSAKSYNVFDWIYYSFRTFIPFTVMSFAYSAVIMDKNLLKKIFDIKRLEPIINTGAIFFIILYYFLMNSAPKLTEVLLLCLFISTFYANVFFVSPILFSKKNKLKYTPSIILLIVIYFFLIWQLGYWKLNLDIYLFIWGLTLIGILIASTYYGYLRLETKKNKLKFEQKESELKLLKSQVNPHFLFNTLNTLYATALQENAPITAESTAKLANLIRYMQNDISEDFIPLENEIKYLEDYIYIQKLRCEITPEINTNFKNVEHHKISPGLLIPFVENAFKYGIDPNKPSSLNVSVIGTGKSIFFKCINSYDDSFNTYYKEKGFGIGIENTKKRLALVYPKNHTLEVLKENNIFSVKISIESK
ncbi:sensor histidine kinase [Cellulophaga sp. Hel_I_12]|uniref:sensor histidine kinase n=1 Tax=Cellulophaga sp. Hel_I_12 TaxID=1249972 RepID=UPI00068D43E4|nr:sensor histidine kinase [Cellulophaga sp. Hel_I_12]